MTDIIYQIFIGNNNGGEGVVIPNVIERELNEQGNESQKLKHTSLHSEKVLLDEDIDDFESSDLWTLLLNHPQEENQVDKPVEIKIMDKVIQAIDKSLLELEEDNTRKQNMSASNDKDWDAIDFEDEFSMRQALEIERAEKELYKSALEEQKQEIEKHMQNEEILAFNNYYMALVLQYIEEGYPLYPAKILAQMTINKAIQMNVLA